MGGGLTAQALSTITHFTHRCYSWVMLTWATSKVPNRREKKRFLGRARVKQSSSRGAYGSISWQYRCSHSSLLLLSSSFTRCTLSLLMTLLLAEGIRALILHNDSGAFSAHRDAVLNQSARCKSVYRGRLLVLPHITAVASLLIHEAHCQLAEDSLARRE